MKKYFIFCILTLITVNIPLSGQSDLQLRYQKKVSHYNQMKRMGGSLIICGSVFTVTGTILTIRGGNRLSSDDYSDPVIKDIVGLEVGIVFLALGIAMDASGITLNIIGNQKSKQYQSKLNNLKMGVICNPNMQGISLVYRF
jgi:hypothetical protein